MRTTLLVSLIALSATALAACSSAAQDDESGGPSAAVTLASDPDARFAKVNVSAYGTPLTAPETSFVCNEPGATDAPGKSEPFAIKDEESLVAKPGAPLFGYSETKPTRKFAAATVLAAMRRMRRYYNSTPYTQGGKSITAPGAHGDASGELFNMTDDGSSGANMGAMPPFWSDLQAVFYVSAARMRHGCWTFVFFSRGNTACRGAAAFSDGFAPTDIYAQTSALCSGTHPVSASCAAPFGSALGALPTTLSAYNLMWVVPGVGGAPNTFVALPEDVRNDMSGALGKKFVVDQLAAGHVNIWDYIMQAGPFAFDKGQMEAVVNAYYGDDKAFAGGAEGATPHFDPCSLTECNQWRTVRPGDPGGGIQCRTTKTNGTNAVGPFGGP